MAAVSMLRPQVQSTSEVIFSVHLELEIGGQREKQKHLQHLQPSLLESSAFLILAHISWKLERSMLCDSAEQKLRSGQPRMLG